MPARHVTATPSVDDCQRLALYPPHVRAVLRLPVPGEYAAGGTGATSAAAAIVTLFRTVILIAAILAAFLIPATASAHQIQCGPRAEVIARLASQYSERVIFRGIAQNAMMELYWSPSRRGWTVAVTTPNRVTCLVVGGKTGEPIPVPPIRNEGGDGA